MAIPFYTGYAPFSVREQNTGSNAIRRQYFQFPAVPPTPVLGGGFEPPNAGTFLSNGAGPGTGEFQFSPPLAPGGAAGLFFDTVQVDTVPPHGPTCGAPLVSGFTSGSDSSTFTTTSVPFAGICFADRPVKVSAKGSGRASLIGYLAPLRATDPNASLTLVPEKARFGSITPGFCCAVGQNIPLGHFSQTSIAAGQTTARLRLRLNRQGRKRLAAKGKMKVLLTGDVRGLASPLFKGSLLLKRK